MKNKVLETYLDDVKRHLGRLPSKEQESILAEMRIHLTEDIGRRRAQDSAVSEEEAALAATHAFGDPVEIAAAQGAAVGGTELTGPGPSPDRFARNFKRTVLVGCTILGGIALLWFLLFLGDAMMGGSSYADYSSNERGEELYYLDTEYQNHSGNQTDVFEVGPNSTRFRVSVHFGAYYSSNGRVDLGGCGGIRLTDPDGLVVVDDSSNCGSLDREVTFTKAGRWTITYVLREFTGHVRVGVTLEDATIVWVSGSSG